MKRNFLIVCLSLLLTMALFSTGLMAKTPDWSGTFTASGNNTTTTAKLPTNPDAVEEVWSVGVGNNTVVIVDGYIYTYNGVTQSYTSDAPGTFYKINKATGQVVDSIELPQNSGYYYSYSIYANERIYVSIPGYVMAFDPATFTHLWTKAVPSCDYATIQYVNNALITNGTVLNGDSGEKIATLSGSYSWSAGAEVGSYFYVAGSDGKLRSFDTATWEEKDSVTFNDGGTPVMYFSGSLYWGSKAGYLYSIKATDGTFDDASLLSYNSNGYIFNAAPVANGNRVYFAGHKPNGDAFNTGYGAIFVLDRNMKLCYAAQTADGGHKFQSTPILCTVTSGGSVVAGMDSVAPQSSTKNYIYVQSYNTPGSLYVLADEPTATSGSLVKLCSPSVPNYAYEQLACDKEGALYYTNDSGRLFKLRTIKATAPEITKDLSTGEVIYEQGDAATALEIEAALSNKGTLSYQWQSRTETGDWKNISNATSSAYTPKTTAIGTTYYRCVAKNTFNGESVTAASSIAKVIVKEKVITDIQVSFRLIGATLAEKAVDYKTVPNESYGSEYKTWFPTKSYTLTSDATAYELFQKAMADAGLTYSATASWVSSITAPAVCGGYALGSKTNGEYSGWMFTINGAHGSQTIGEQKLSDGDVMILHYVNDYRYEEDAAPWLSATDEAPQLVYGDLNLDGRIDLMDVTLLRRYVAKWDIEIFAAAADVNGSGTVDLVDVTVLRRYVANWDITLGA